jgi:hypothetical protein
VNDVSIILDFLFLIKLLSQYVKELELPSPPTGGA